MNERAVVHAPEAPAPAGDVRPAAPAPHGSAVVPAVPAPGAAPRAVRSMRLPRGRTATWSMTLSTFALVVSWFVPWALPLGVIGVVLAVIALAGRRAKRELAWWGLGLGLGSILCSAFWILWVVRAVQEAAGA